MEGAQQAIKGAIINSFWLKHESRQHEQNLLRKLCAFIAVVVLVVNGTTKQQNSVNHFILVINFLWVVNKFLHHYEHIFRDILDNDRIAGLSEQQQLNNYKSK